MKYKKKFLEDLTTELKKRKISSGDIIDYYTEIIDEKIASGSTENKAVKALGSMDDIMHDIEIDQQLSEANKKPTLSNGIKALIAVLGVLSLPVLIIVAVVVFSLLIALGAVLVSVIISLGAVILALILAVVGFIVGVVMGEVSVAWLVLAIGVLLVLVPLCVEAIRRLVFLIRKFVMWLASTINKKRSSKGVKK